MRLINSILLVVVGFLFICLAGAVYAGEIYSWTDKNGTMIFSESPPPTGTDTSKIILEKEGPLKIRIGMHQNQVLSLPDWGEPKSRSVFVSLTKSEVDTVWYYGKGRILTFTNKILTKIEN